MAEGEGLVAGEVAEDGLGLGIGRSEWGSMIWCIIISTPRCGNDPLDDRYSSWRRGALYPLSRERWKLENHFYHRQQTRSSQNRRWRN